MLKVHLAHSQQNRGNQPCWNYLQIQFMQSIHVSGTLFLIPAHGNLIAKFEPLSGYLSFFKDFMDGKRIQCGPALLQGLTTILTFSECKTWEPRKTWLRQSERIDSRAASFTGTFKLYSSLTQKVSAMEVSPHSPLDSWISPHFFADLGCTLCSQLHWRHCVSTIMPLITNSQSLGMYESLNHFLQCALACTCLHWISSSIMLSGQVFLEHVVVPHSLE